MTKKLFALLLIPGFVSCGQNNQQNESPADSNNPVADSMAIINDPKNNLTVQTNSFSEIDSSGILMFPLSMGESERGSGSSFSYNSMPSSGSYWNIIFYNSNTNQYHLLSDRKMLISNFASRYSSSANIEITEEKRHIFYTIITDDYNRDKKLTYEDPHYLFVSDKEGNNFRQISPLNYSLSNWQFIKATNKIIMTVTKDSDKNNKFEDKDEVTAFKIDIDKEAEAKEIFSNDFRNKLKVLYDRDWKRLKK